jgi:hypothetical protein
MRSGAFERPKRRLPESALLLESPMGTPDASLKRVAAHEEIARSVTRWPGVGLAGSPQGGRLQ